MTDSLPDYSAIQPPDGKRPVEYSHHERRAELLQLIIGAGSPFAINQSRIAERYDVHRSTICRDMARLRESVADQLGEDAKLTTRALFESVTGDLLEEDDWRAQKAAFDIVMDWNEWLAAIGEQEREPERSKLDMDVDMRSRHSEVAYHVVREDDGEDLPTTEDSDGERVDYEDLGFAAGPNGSGGT